MSIARRSLALALAALMALAPGAALAQAEQAEIPPAEAAPTEAVAPYDDELLRLSELLGAIHYLRGLCGAGEGAKWRDMMAELLTVENPPEKRRARLTARFNRGYTGFAQNHTRCTEAARTAAERYRKEGIRIAARVVSRYGR